MSDASEDRDPAAPWGHSYPAGYQNKSGLENTAMGQSARNHEVVYPDQAAVAIMASGAQSSVVWSTFWSRDDARELMRAALTALREAGYTVTRSGHGIAHGQQPFEGEPTT